MSERRRNPHASVISLRAGDHINALTAGTKTRMLVRFVTPTIRHSSITQAAELGQKAGLGLDKIRVHSRHHSIATLMLYADEYDRPRTQQTLAAPRRPPPRPLVSEGGQFLLSLDNPFRETR